MSILPKDLSNPSPPLHSTRRGSSRSKMDLQTLNCLISSRLLSSQMLWRNRAFLGFFGSRYGATARRRPAGKCAKRSARNEPT